MPNRDERPSSRSILTARPRRTTIRLAWALGFCITLAALYLELASRQASASLSLNSSGANANASTQTTSQPLESVLNPDGTLNTTSGFNGSLDPTGWELASGKGEPPTFKRSPLVPGDENWDDRFGLNGTDGNSYQINAVAVRGADVYIGGSFTFAGSVAAYNVAMWDGVAWSALGSGTNGTVYALVVSGNDVYAGGSFTTAGGVSANRIAKWNTLTNSWSALGSPTNGVNSTVYAITAVGPDIYVGGFFTSVGNGVGAKRIAKWDGSNWSALGSGVNNGVDGTFPSVQVITQVGGYLYIGGQFTTAAGSTITANYIARWDTTVNTWTSVGSGVNNGTNNNVNAIVLIGASLYVGGYFTSAGAVSDAKGVVRFDLATLLWYQLGSGYYNGVNGTVFGLTVSGSDLYVGGYFNTAGAITGTNNLAKWSTASSTWSQIVSGSTNGVNGRVNALLASSSNLYVAGDYSQAGGIAASNIARWNISGSSWFGMGGSGIATNSAGHINAIAISGADVFVGGQFTETGSLITSNIAKWDGSSWSALGSGVSYNGQAGFGAVNAIAVRGTEVFVGGFFTRAGNITATNVAVWSTSSNAWFPLQNSANTNEGVSGGSYNVLAITTVGTSVYVAGDFTSAAGVSVNHIARWNADWYALGAGANNGVDNRVNTLTAIGTDLYAGGRFVLAGGVGVNHVAKWDGATWSALSSGTNNDVNGLAVGGSDLYAGGVFTSAGGVSVNRIAKWNSVVNTWSALGSGANNGANDVVTALSAYGSDLYVGGLFTAVGGTTVPASYVALWNGAAWSALGSGVIVNSEVDALIARNGNVCVGGTFYYAGGKPSLRFGIWYTSQPTPTATRTPTFTSTPTSTPTITPTPCAPAQVNVSIVNFDYLPQGVTIYQNQTVFWSNDSTSTHTTSSNTGVWNSGNMPQNSFFEYQFNTAGVFPYHCNIHPGSMMGTITVLAGCVPTSTPTSTSTPTYTATITNTRTPTPTVPTATPTRTTTPTPCGVSNYNKVGAIGTIVAGTADIGNHCDNCQTTINLPFLVQLYDQFFTTVAIESNGKAHFQSAPIASVNACLPSAGHTFTIYPYWDDLTTLGGGLGVFTSISETAPNRLFHIEWRTAYVTGGGTANFELRLYEGGPRFDIVYGTVSQGNASATGGVQRDGTFFTQDFCNGSGSGPGLVATYLLFVPLCNTATPGTFTSTPTPTYTPTRTPTCVPNLAYVQNTDLTIPDVTTVTSTLNIPDSFTISTIEVIGVSLTHTYASDLDVFLISPTGVQVELFTAVCGNNVWTLANTGFSLGDNKSDPIGSVCPPGTGKYRPEGALSAFLGQNTLGAWKLRITDNFDADTGLLDSWGLRFGGGACPTLTPAPPNPTPTCAPNQIGPWVIRSPIPTAVRYNSVTSDGAYAYSVGGVGTVLLNQFARYDPASDVWTPLAPLPAALSAPLAVYGGNNKIMVFGGADASNTVTSTTRIYDISSNTWTTGASMPGPRGGMGGGLYNGKIYVVGGTNTTSLTTVVSQTWEYNVVANTWLTKTSMPQGLSVPGYGVIGSHLYIAGGTSSGTTYRNILYDYDLNDNTWTTRTNLLVGTKAPGSAVFNGRLLLFGGGNLPTITQVYDPASNSWSQGPFFLHVGREALGGASVGSYVVAVGGYNGASVNTVEVMLQCSLTTPTPTPTLSPTFTPTPQPLLVGHVTIQSRPAQPHSLQSVPITLTLKSGGVETNYTTTTDPSGFFTVTAPSPGAYNWRVKNLQTLANSGSVTLVNGTNQQEMGLLLEGDADNTNCVSVTDFNILKVTFGRALGDPGYDARADFDGTNAVSVTDFNLIKLNFGTCGANPISIRDE